MSRDKIRTYSELIRLPTFEERFEYLKLSGIVGSPTFAAERYLNQRFYHDNEWQSIRNSIIIRDYGHDLAMMSPEFEIVGPVYVHHMNPVMIEDIVDFTEFLTNPEYLVCTSFSTHNAIHYSSLDTCRAYSVERVPNDTCPWRKEG